MSNIQTLINNDKPTILTLCKGLHLHFTPQDQNKYTPGEHRLVFSRANAFPSNEEDIALLNGLKTALKNLERHGKDFKLQPFLQLVHPKHGRLFCTVIEWKEYEPAAQAALFDKLPATKKATHYD